MKDSENYGTFAAVIAAAGLSSRMGDFKPLLPFGNSTIIGSVIGAFQDAGAAEVIVVCGHRGEELAEYVSACGAVPIQNCDFAQCDMFTSLRIGIKALKSAPQRVFLTPGDVPRITAQLLKKMLQSRAEWAVPICGGKSAHPVLLDAKALMTVADYSGNDGLKGALSVLGNGEKIPWDDQSVLLDADTQADYQRLLQYR